MKLIELERRLSRALRGPLPGVAGQARLAPRPRRGWRPGQPAAGSKAGAALLLLYPRPHEPHLILTVRNATLPHHGGQVSLPGGAVEPGESIEAAALREAREEAGIEPAEVRLLGRLSPLDIPVSRFLLHPVIGIAERRPTLAPESGEVDRILEVPLEHLADPSRVEIEEVEDGERRAAVPFLNVEGARVWGATAMVLSELLCLLGRPPDPWGEG